MKGQEEGESKGIIIRIGSSVYTVY